eukprot:scaffold230327_cov30-Tisochrysis_lutea.AAC.3
MPRTSSIASEKVGRAPPASRLPFVLRAGGAGSDWPQGRPANRDLNAAEALTAAASNHLIGSAAVRDSVSTPSGGSDRRLPVVSSAESSILALRRSTTDDPSGSSTRESRVRLAVLFEAAGTPQMHTTACGFVPPARAASRSVDNTAG